MSQRDEIKRIESKMDLFELTDTLGMYSYKYERSHFIDYFINYLELGANDTFFDLGSGYGEVLIPFAKRFKLASFIGIEIVKSRFAYSVKLSEQMLLQNVLFRNEDLIKSNLTSGNYFYLFNPLFDFQYPSLISKLKEVSAQKEITIISEAKSSLYFDAVDWLDETHRVRKNFLVNAKVYKSK